MMIFQYWDSPNPPDEIGRWIDGFRITNTEFEHKLFNRDSAIEFIAENYDDRHVEAFRACAVPAMQADCFRLCALIARGGIWVDADNQSLAPLSELVMQAPEALVFTFFDQMNNGFLWFRHPGNEFLRASLEVATDNITARRFSSGMTATGPGIFNAIRALVEPEREAAIVASYDNPICADWDFPVLLEIVRRTVTVTPKLIEAHRAITLIAAFEASRWIGAEQPSYKATGRHWLNWKGSIYL